MNFPENLLYTDDHEWVRIEGTTATVGVTEFAAGELGDIVYVDVDTEGETLEKGDTFGSIEAVKTVADLFMPIDGEVSGLNEALEEAPETVNNDPYGEGWLVQLTVSEDVDTSHLMNAEAYGAHVAKSVN